jgi:hypothetical protein
MDKHHRDNGIDMDVDEFSTVTINQSVPNNFGLLPLVQPSSIVSVSSQNENGAVPSQSSDIADLQEIAIVKKAEEKKDDEEEDDEDDEDEMTDEEYLASKKHLLTTVKIK